MLGVWHVTPPHLKYNKMAQQETWLYNIGWVYPPDEAKSGGLVLTQEVLSNMSNNGIVILADSNFYTSDDAAENAGIADGEYYKVAVNNEMGITVGNGGVIKQKQP